MVFACTTIPSLVVLFRHQNGSKEALDEVSQKEMKSVIIGSSTLFPHTPRNLHKDIYFHVVFIQINIKDGPICAGISDGHQIWTAAHCIHKFKPEDLLVGDSTYFPAEVATIKIHDGFDMSTLNNDIALITLKDQLNSTTSQYKLNRNLAKADFLAKPGLVLGITNDCEITGEIEKKIVHLEDISDCNETFEGAKLAQENGFCGKSDQGLKGGDSGAPLLIQGEIVGLVSGGERNCRKDKESLTTFVNVGFYYEYMLNLDEDLVESDGF